MKRKLTTAYALDACLSIGIILSFLSCSSNGPAGDKAADNFVKVGSFTATYDPVLGTVDYQTVEKGSDAGSTTSFTHGLGYADSTGVADGAIKDHSKSAGSINYTMGLVDPDSCATDYNNTTHVLSFYAKIVNKSNLANNYNAGTNPTGYEYTNVASFPPNTTFYTPFYFVITGLDWDTVTYPQLVTAVNTNLQGAYCNGANGLTLSSCDGSGIFGQSSANNRFDSIYPDRSPVADYTGLPGWDFTPFITSGVMAPGADSGCVLFQQYTLTQNQSFTIYFDLLAVKQSGSAPPKPVVVSPATPSYANTNTITVTVSNLQTNATLYVDGGTVQASCTQAAGASTCGTSGGNRTITVTLRQNQLNTLSVYQVLTGLQSPSATLAITHDNVVPTMVSWSPANNEQVVGTVTRCVATFSEPMDSTTFNGGTGTGTNSCDTMNFGMCAVTNNVRVAGTTTWSSDKTQAIYTPSAALSGPAVSYTCNAKTATGAPTQLKDLAGNVMSPTSTVTFLTGSSGQDKTAPYVKSIFPADNTTISRSTSFYVYFSEPIQSATLTNTDCSGAGLVPNLAVVETATCSVTGFPTPRPSPVAGTISLNAEGDIATYTPSATMQANDCISILVSSCVKDLAGNALPLRNPTVNIAAYGDTLNVSAFNIFYTSGTADVTGPSLVHVGPMLNATSVPGRIFPFVVFNEPIDVSTIVTDYFYLTNFGNPTKFNVSLKADPTLQLVTYKVSSTNASFTADTSNGSATLSNVSSVSSVVTGLSISGTGIPAGTKISAINVGAGQITMSNNATGTGTGVSITAALYPTTSMNNVLTVTGAVTDTSGNLMVAPQTSNFTTASIADTTAPAVWRVAGYNGLGVAQTTTGSTISRCSPIEIDFKEQGTLHQEPMDETTINGANITLLQGGTFAVPADLQLSDNGMHLKLLPQASLYTGTTALTFTATRVNGNATVTGVSPVAGLFPGMALTGTGIRAGATISSVNSAAQTVTMSLTASSAGTNTVTVTAGCGTSSLACKYTPTISTAVKDRAGNALAATYNAITFTAAAETNKPTVAIAPAAASTVAQNGSFALFFSESMDRSTLSNTNIMFPNAANGLCSSGFWTVFPSEDGRWAVLNCYNNMSAGSSAANRAVQVTTGARDRYVGTDNANCEGGTGNTLSAAFSATGYTIGVSDVTAPTVNSVSPVDGTTSVSAAAAPAVTFSEPIDPRTVLPSTLFLMDQQGNIVNTTLSFNSTATTITLTPVQALDNPGIYYIVGTTAIRDLGGGNAYDGNGGETTSIPGILRTCFSTSAATCP